MNEQEKEKIYKQMSIVLEQIQKLMKTYDDWQNYLLGHENEVIADEKKAVVPNKFAQEVESQKYFSKKGTQSIDNSYQTVAFKISSILKESAVPLSTRKVHELLLEEGISSISYSNLSKNILRRAHNDPKMNVERAYRGYWQYRLIH